MKQVGHRVRRSHRPLNRLVAGIAGVFIAVGALASANIVQADSVQIQSYQRAGQADNCVSPPESISDWRGSWANPNDPISGPAWHPTWEQWANNGNGGWTCTRSITWARDSAARIYNVGDIGPGGGLIFLIANGLTYEMAPKNWGAAETTEVNWCNAIALDIADAEGTAIGTGANNTQAIVASCTSGASNDAAAYRGGGFTDWFLPSRDELNAMCHYSRNLSAAPDSTVSCFGDSGTSQNGMFASSPYGFASGDYWSSSQDSSSQFSSENYAWWQNLVNGSRTSDGKSGLHRVRPIRAF